MGGKESSAHTERKRHVCRWWGRWGGSEGFKWKLSQVLCYFILYCPSSFPSSCQSEKDYCLCEYCAALPMCLNAYLQLRTQLHTIWLCLCLNDSCKFKTLMQDVWLNSDLCPGDVILALDYQKKQNTQSKTLFNCVINSCQNRGENQGTEPEERR